MISNTENWPLTDTSTGHTNKNRYKCNPSVTNWRHRTAEINTSLSKRTGTIHLKLSLAVGQKSIHQNL